MIINFNILLYIGFSFVIGGFILFIIAQHYERKAEKKLLPLQSGDVKETYADVKDLVKDFKYKPTTKYNPSISYA